MRPPDLAHRRLQEQEDESSRPLPPGPALPSHAKGHPRTALASQARAQPGAAAPRSNDKGEVATALYPHARGKPARAPPMDGKGQPGTALPPGQVATALPADANAQARVARSARPARYAACSTGLKLLTLVLRYVTCLVLHNSGALLEEPVLKQPLSSLNRTVKGHDQGQHLSR